MEPQGIGVMTILYIRAYIVANIKVLVKQRNI